MKQYYVYILMGNSGTLYIGVTNDLVRRMIEHRNKLVPGFTSSYSVSQLVYYEATSEVRAALEREKQLKRWHRDWKLNLICSANPLYDDLFDSENLTIKTLNQVQGDNARKVVAQDQRSQIKSGMTGGEDL
jgi:putative endonuclease